MQKSVTVSYTISLEESDFKKVLEVAQEMGYDFQDAGPVETVRRYFQDSGTGDLDELLGPKALISSTYIHRDFIKAIQEQRK